MIIFNIGFSAKLTYQKVTLLTGEKNNNIFPNMDQITVSRVPL